MKYIKLIIVSLSLTLLFNVGSAAAAGINGNSVNLKLTSSFVGDACNAISTTVTNTGCSKGQNTLVSAAHTVVTLLSVVVGVISIIMILVAGLRFITANGDTNSIAAARTTLIYALVGVFIAVLAQLLVHYVLSTSNKIQSNSYLNNSSWVRRDS